MNDENEKNEVKLLRVTIDQTTRFVQTHHEVHITGDEPAEELGKTALDLFNKIEKGAKKND